MRDRLVRLAYRFTWNRDDAEDAVQEALGVAYDRAGELRDASRWWAWVRSIVIQQCRLLGRRSLMEKRHQRRLAEGGARPTATGAGVPEAGDDELKAMVRLLLAELPPRQREVIVLRHLEDLSFDEIGELLAMSPSTARVHAIKGREALRKLVLKRFPEWGE